MKTVIIKITVIYIQINNNNNKATATPIHFKAVKCKEYREGNRLTGKGLVTKRQNIGHVFFLFLQETFWLKSDYVIANSSDIFSDVVCRGIRYL